LNYFFNKFNKIIKNFFKKIMNFISARLLLFLLLLASNALPAAAQQNGYTYTALSSSVTLAYQVVNRLEIDFQLICMTQYWCAIGRKRFFK
jgi:hypothetical protein